MSAAKKGLGRGISALFGDMESKPVGGKEQVTKILISDLEKNKYQIAQKVLLNKSKLHN